MPCRRRPRPSGQANGNGHLQRRRQDVGQLHQGRYSVDVTDPPVVVVYALHLKMQLIRVWVPALGVPQMHDDWVEQPGLVGRVLNDLEGERADDAALCVVAPSENCAEAAQALADTHQLRRPDVVVEGLAEVEGSLVCVPDKLLPQREEPWVRETLHRDRALALNRPQKLGGLLPTLVRAERLALAPRHKCKNPDFASATPPRVLLPDTWLAVAVGAPQLLCQGGL
mmetsp:Transcript_12117/g.38255  ORF Transcript_12117/g.38255 Transcript_12117/m.38255 type:complete len:226 (+) Transcript_12117:867-1544(+)